VTADLRILAVNAGSSSLKFAVYEAIGTNVALRAGGAVDPLGPDARLSARSVDGAPIADERVAGATDAAHAVAAVARWLAERGEAGAVSAVGHRVVHGGTAFADPVEIDDGVVDALRALSPLAPLHQPQCVAAIAASRAAFAGARHVACFDTAFHRTLPAPERAYALPRRISALGVRRYGFHGLSYEHLAEALRGSSRRTSGAARASARFAAAVASRRRWA
jgi:acetate kinase